MATREIFANDTDADRLTLAITLMTSAGDGAASEAGNTVLLQHPNAAAGATFASTNTLVAVDAAKGAYKLVLTSAEAAALKVGTRLRVLYDSAGTVPFDDTWPVAANPYFDVGTAQAGAVGSITLRAGAPSVSLAGSFIQLTKGTGAPAARACQSYNTTTKVFTPDVVFDVAPDNTTEYVVHLNAPSPDLAKVIHEAPTATYGTVAGSALKKIVDDLTTLTSRVTAVVAAATDLATLLTRVPSEVATDTDAQTIRTELAAVAALVDDVGSGGLATVNGKLDTLVTRVPSEVATDADVTAIRGDIAAVQALVDDVGSGGLATLNTAIAGVPAATVTALKADADWKSLRSFATGKFAYTPPASLPGNGTLVLYDTDGSTILKTLTLSVNGAGDVTARN